MRKWGTPKQLTLPQQLLFLKGTHTGSGDVSRGKLIWRLEAQPTPISRTYSLRLEYSENGAPDVFVEQPSILLLADGRELPHVYHNPLRLCLYLPGSDQWTPAKRLDRTIVPWAYTWLYYFEDWLACGEWRGEGLHPSDEPEGLGNRRARRMVRRVRRG